MWSHLLKKSIMENLFFVQCVERLLDFRDRLRTLSNIYDEDILQKELTL